MNSNSSSPPPLPIPPAVPDREAALLFDARTVLLFGEITSALAADVSRQLLALAALNDDPIRVYLHSQGGHVEAGDSLFDMIRFVNPVVTIIGTGWVASAGALIFCSVERSRRLALPNTRFLLHEPRGGVGGSASDVEIEAEQVLAMRSRLNQIFAEATGNSPEQIARDTIRNHWMNAQAALSYGLVGKIVSRNHSV